MRYQPTILLGLVVLGLHASGCGGREQGPSMDHVVEVPRRYREGRGVEYVPSNHETYLQAYEEGWWRCVKKYAGDINYCSTAEDKVVYGGHIRVEAFAKGFADAEARIHDQVEKYGRQRVQAELVALLEAK